MIRRLRLPPTNQQGQIGVIILLIMVVLMTIGLSVASRTTQEVMLTQQTADSTRVFNAAETGIEEALGTDLESATFVDEEYQPSDINLDDINVNYVIRRHYELETRLFEGVSVAVDLPKDGTTNTNGIIVEWSKESNCGSEDPASLIASIYNHNTSTDETTVRYRALGGCDRSDGFEIATTLAPESTYHYQFTLPLENDDIMVRLKPVYNDTHVNVRGNGWTLPVQYFNIRSEASNNLGDETRIVEVNKTVPTAPSFMDYALYSGSTIVK